MDKTPPTIFSRRRAAAKWRRAIQRHKRDGSTSFLLDEMSSDIAERLAFMQLKPANALVVGDWSEAMPRTLSDLRVEIAIGLLGEFDEEAPGPAGRFDLITHLMGLGMVNDLPGALIHARNALADGGLFFAAFPGAGSLDTLRGIMLAADGDRPSPRIHPLIDTAAASALLQRAGFRRQVVDNHTLSVRYRSLPQLVSDLRDHGLTASLERGSPAITRAGYKRALDAFDARRDDYGKVSETFEILTLTAWK